MMVTVERTDPLLKCICSLMDTCKLSYRFVIVDASLMFLPQFEIQIRKFSG